MPIERTGDGPVFRPYDDRAAAHGVGGNRSPITSRRIRLAPGDLARSGRLPAPSRTWPRRRRRRIRALTRRRPRVTPSRPPLPPHRPILAAAIRTRTTITVAFRPTPPAGTARPPPARRRRAFRPPVSPACRCPPGTVPVAAQPVCNAAPAARLASRPAANCGGSLPPCYNAAAVGSLYGNPSPAPSARSSGQPIDITDLPEHRDGGLSLPPPPTGAVADASPGLPAASQVVQTAANVPAGDGDHAAAGPRQTNYADDSGYQSLRGRLEYSTVEKVWKLRIAPANGGESGQTRAS